nr:basic salivary proline-rich protein 1-like [Melopsittacus undulatus]
MRRGARPAPGRSQGAGLCPCLMPPPRSQAVGSYQPTDGTEDTRELTAAPTASASALWQRPTGTTDTPLCPRCGAPGYCGRPQHLPAPQDPQPPPPAPGAGDLPTSAFESKKGPQTRRRPRPPRGGAAGGARCLGRHGRGSNPRSSVYETDALPLGHRARRASSTGAPPVERSEPPPRPGELPPAERSGAPPSTGSGRGPRDGERRPPGARGLLQARGGAPGTGVTAPRNRPGRRNGSSACGAGLPAAPAGGVSGRLFRSSRRQRGPHRWSQTTELPADTGTSSSRLTPPDVSPDSKDAHRDTHGVPSGNSSSSG